MGHEKAHQWPWVDQVQLKPKLLVSAVALAAPQDQLLAHHDTGNVVVNTLHRCLDRELAHTHTHVQFRMSLFQQETLPPPCTCC